MNVAFRVDASTQIGSGHVMRCLTLADTLSQKSHQVIFICREYPGHLIELIKRKGYIVYSLPFSEYNEYNSQMPNNNYAKWLWIDANEDAKQTQEVISDKRIDWLIIDHYGLDATWEKSMRPYAHKIMCIDDLANRPHDCDILLDQNFYQNLEYRYDGLVSNICLKLLGPKYALMRPELGKIKEKRKSLGKFGPHSTKNILVYMGASDLNNITGYVLQTLLNIPNVDNYDIHVVTGAINPHKDQIKNLCDANSFLHYYHQPLNYLDLLTDMDLAISAGGTSTYERCYIGLPSIVFILAMNQKNLVTDIAHYGAHYYCENNQFNFQSIVKKIENNFISYQAKMSALLDGYRYDHVMEAIVNASY